MNSRLRIVVIVVVTAVWAGNFIASVVVDGYVPSESINGIFMIVAGGLYAADRSAKRDEERKDERREEEKKKAEKDEQERPGSATHDDSDVDSSHGG